MHYIILFSVWLRARAAKCAVSGTSRGQRHQQHVWHVAVAAVRMRTPSSDPCLSIKTVEENQPERQQKRYLGNLGID